MTARTPLVLGADGLPQQFQSGDALVGLAPVRVAKSSAYTVVAADLGKLIVCTGVFTLSLTAAATLGTGFFFYVDCTNTTGAVTIDPNSAETVEGQTTIALYGAESKYMIFTDGTAWYTLGRQKGWVQTDVVNAASVSSIAIATVCADPEARDVELDFEAMTLVISGSVNLTFIQGTSTAGVPVGDMQTHTTVVADVAVSASPVVMGVSSTTAIAGSILFKNIKGTSANQIRLLTQFSFAAYTRLVQAFSSAAGALASFTFGPGSGTFSTQYSVRIFRQ